VPQIDVRTEQETPHGWRYEIAVTRGAERSASARGGATIATRTSSHVVTLAWVDHEFWCGGAQPPSRTIQSVVAFLLERESDPSEAFTLPERFDASTARRWYPSIDERFGMAG
jgi:hypothetical protein